MTSGGNRSYNWNVDNQPTSVTGPDGVQETYTYDAMGERLSRTRQGTTTYYLGLWEEENNGKTRAQYKFGGQVIAQRERVSGVDTVIYLSSDHLGSASLVTSSSTGALVSQQEFDSWGKVRSGGVGQTTINYTGQKLDGTGLLYYHARYYDPGLAKFVSADSIVPGAGDPQSYNRYSYVRNNPLSRTDPTGHCDTGDTECEKVLEKVKKYPNIPKGVESWGWDKLSQLLWWLEHGVQFTSNKTDAGPGAEWTDDEIWEVIKGLGRVYNYLTQKQGFTMTQALAALGIKYNTYGSVVETFLTFNKYTDNQKSDSDRKKHTPGGLYEDTKDRPNTINLQFADKECNCYDLEKIVVHEIGHVVDRQAGIAKGLPGFWSRGQDTPGEANWRSNVDNYEDFANKFRDMVYGDPISGIVSTDLNTALNIIAKR